MSKLSESLTSIKIGVEVLFLIVAIILMLKVKDSFKKFDDTIVKTRETIAQIKTDESNLVIQVTSKDGIIEKLNSTLFITNQTIGQVKTHEGELAARLKTSDIIGNMESTSRNLESTSEFAKDISFNLRTTTDSINHRLYDHGELMDIVKKASLHIDQVAGETEITTKRERAHLDILLGPCVSDISPEPRQPCIAKSLDSIAGVTGNLNSVTGDFKDSLHQTLHPSKKSLIGGFSWTAIKLFLGYAVKR